MARPVHQSFHNDIRYDRSKAIRTHVDFDTEMPAKAGIRYEFAVLIH